MKVAGGGFEQCFNAQAVVDTELPGVNYFDRSASIILAGGSEA